jgi:hypothetical protein
MANSIYGINKGVNRPAEFKGLKAQYIWYLGGGLVGLLVLFAILYIIGTNTFVCLGVIGLLGGGLFVWVYRLSNTYGQYGLMKKAAQRNVPGVIRVRCRELFIKKRNF